MIKLVNTLLSTYTELFSAIYNTTNKRDFFHDLQEKISKPIMGITHYQATTE